MNLLIKGAYIAVILMEFISSGFKCFILQISLSQMTPNSSQRYKKLTKEGFESGGNNKVINNKYIFIELSSYKNFLLDFFL
jgi:hypothetical protein